MQVSRKLLRNCGYIFFLMVVIFLALEIILRIYNPFPFRLKGDQILLPVNTTTTIYNKINPRLDSVIVNSRNELGFRGPAKPTDFDHQLSIITVGGSTTECHFNSDNKTWPYLLGQELESSFQHLWLNNAGLDGHSTFGHQVLLHDHIARIKPKLVLFLTGINDIESDQPSFHDQLNKRGAWSDLKHYLVGNSELLSLLLNLSRGWKAQKAHNTTGVFIDPGSLPVSRMTPEKKKEVLARQQPYLQQYRERIGQLIDTCIRYDIIPVFITQPMLYGHGIDSVTKIDLARVQHLDMSGECAWEVLEQYNDVVRSVCSSKNVHIADLALLMPKNSFYFYDVSHYTNEGARKVADILYGQLKPYLSTTFPAFKK